MINKLVNAALAGAGLALVVGAIEAPALFGWVDYRFLAGGMEARRVAPQPRPHPPGKHMAGQMPGDLVEPLRLGDRPQYPFDFQADRRGFRNARDLDRADVVVLGDSFVENARLGDAEILTSRLAAELSIDVVGLGRSGFGPLAELGALREHLAGLHPKVVVWVFFEGNDLADIRATTEPPSPTFRDRSFVRNAALVIGRVVDDVFGSGEGEEDAARHRCTPRCPKPPCEPLYFGFRSEPLSGDDERALESAFDILSEAKRLTTDAGATLTLAYAPSKFRVYHDVCQRPLGEELQTWTLNDLPERIWRWSEENDVPYVDLTPDLSAAAERGEPVYFADDTHWNARANEIAGDALASVIRSRLNGHPDPREPATAVGR